MPALAEPVVSSSGRMIPAVIPRLTLPKARRRFDDPYAYLGHEDITPPPRAGLASSFGRRRIPQVPVSQADDPYAYLGHEDITTADLGLQAPAQPALPAPAAPSPTPARTPEERDTFLGDVALAGKVVAGGLYSAIADVLPKT